MPLDIWLSFSGNFSQFIKDLGGHVTVKVIDEVSAE
jgi:hypothetical protein